MVLARRILLPGERAQSGYRHGEGLCCRPRVNKLCFGPEQQDQAQSFPLCDLRSDFQGPSLDWDESSPRTGIRRNYLDGREHPIHG
jgi:hypothetical protein